MKVTEGKPTDFVPDKDNANQGSPRGQKMIQDSLQEDGAGRSVVSLFSSFNISTGFRTAHLFSVARAISFLAYWASFLRFFRNTSKETASGAINTILIRAAKGFVASCTLLFRHCLQRLPVTFIATKLSVFCSGNEQFITLQANMFVLLPSFYSGTSP